jgi:peptide-methionine (S)-S-oxide reductase
MKTFWKILISASVVMGAYAPAIAQTAPKTATAIFAGGCFWCLEPPCDKVDGVLSTTSGYIGGATENPTYNQVSSGTSGHVEALRIIYDPAKVNYETLLDVFWRNHDPFSANGQFCDRGPQYRAVIYHGSPREQAQAESTKAAFAARFNKAITTEITAASAFYPAEGYHQDYYLKNPIKYKYYRYQCGRDARLKEVWGE